LILHQIHRIRFPRYVDDIVSERRTLFHMPVGIVCSCSGDPADPDYTRSQRCKVHVWTVGDEIRLLDPDSPRCKIGVLIDVRQVRLLAVLDVDLTKLGQPERASYLASWDALHPDCRRSTDPVVWRIEFRYGIEEDPKDPPEWSLAA
jgi:hypothetical protein